MAWPTVPPADAVIQLSVDLADYLRHAEQLPPTIGCSASELDTFAVHIVRLTPARGQLVVNAVDLAGQPVSGARILRRPNGEWDVSELALTDAAGRAVVRGLAPGLHLLRAESAARLRGDIGLDDLAWQPIQLENGVESEITLLADRLEELCGSVHAGGQPLSGARLSLGVPGPFWSRWEEEMDGDVRRHMTDEAGGFCFERLLPGTYDLAIDHPASGLRTRRSVRVEHGQGRIEIDVDDTALAGYVLDEQGHAVEGAEVFAFSAPERHFDLMTDARDLVVLPGARLPGPDLGHAPIAQAKSDSAGRFVLRGVPPREELGLVFQKGELSGVRTAWASQGVLKDGVNAVLHQEASLQLELAAPEHGGVQSLGLLGHRLDAPDFVPGIALVVDEAPALETFRLPPGRWLLRVFELDAFERVARIGPTDMVVLAPGGEGSAKLGMPSASMGR